MSQARILIVEDEVVFAEGLRRTLARLGYDVPAIVRSGREAVARAAELRPDLVLMDIRLEGEMDGIEAAAEIRTRFDVPIVYLTAHGGEETLARARSTGPAGYLLKPFGGDMLHSTVEMALYKHQAETRLRDSEARLRSLFDRVPVGLYRTTPGGQFLDANPALVRMLGYPDLESLLRTNAAGLYETAENRRRWQDRLEREGEVHGLEMRFRRYDGAIVWLNENARAVRDAGGEMLYYEGSLEDITGRKRMEEIVEAIHEGTARATGAQFFRELVRRLGELLGVRYAYVARLLDGAEVRTVAVWAGGDYAGNLTYSLGGTPCEKTVQTSTCFYPSHVKAHFPRGHLLVEMEVESYMGTPLRDTDGQANGLLVVMDDHPMEDVPLFRHVLEVFAARAGAELGRREAEEALQHSLERYRAVVNDQTDFIVRWTSGGIRTFVNDAYCKYFGLAREQILGTSFLNLVDSSDRKMVEDKISRLTPANPAEVDEHRVLRADGSIGWNEWVDRAIFDESGSLVEFQSVGRDITDRKHAEEALRRRQEQLEVLRRMGLEIAAQLDLDAVLQAIVTRAIELLAAQSGGFFVCRPEQDLLEWAVAVGLDLPPEGKTLPKGQGLSGRIWQTGRPLIVDDYTSWPGRDESFARYAIGAVIGVPVHWGDELLGVLDLQADAPRTFSTEDTELLTLLAAQASIAIKNAQLFQAERRRWREAEALRQAGLVFGSTLDTDRILEKLLDQIGAVIPFDCANVMWIEGERVHIMHQRGYKEMGIGDAVAELVLSVAETTYLSQMASTRRPHIVPDTWSDPGWVRLDVTHWIRSWAGAPITARDDVLGFFSLDSGTPNFYTPEHANLLAAFAAHASMAIENARLFAETQAAYKELKQAQVQLVQSAKLAAIGELAAGVAHEINNPLTSILGFAELLSGELAPDDPGQQDLEIILTEAKRTRDIVRNLLEFARQTEPLTDLADVNDILRQTLALVRAHVEKEGVTIEEDYAVDLAPIPLDAGQMKQVFLNLITNAAHAMPGRGTLAVSTAQVENQVVVRFADTGLGIPPGDRERIFEPFFTTKPSGTGLGLSVSLGIVQQHGGRIEVESQVGQGSTFTIWLPARDER